MTAPVLSPAARIFPAPSRTFCSFPAAIWISSEKPRITLRWLSTSWATPMIIRPNRDRRYRSTPPRSTLNPHPEDPAVASPLRLVHQAVGDGEDLAALRGIRRAGGVSEARREGDDGLAVRVQADAGDPLRDAAGDDRRRGKVGLGE